MASILVLRRRASFWCHLGVALPAFILLAATPRVHAQQRAAITNANAWSWQSGLLEVKLQLLGISSLSEDEQEAFAGVIAELFDVADDDITVKKVATAAPTKLPTALPTPQPTAPTAPTGRPTPAPTRSLASYAEPGVLLECGGTERVEGDTRFRPSVQGTNKAGDVVYAFRQTGDGSVTISTCGSKYDTFISLYDAKTLRVVGQNDDDRRCSASGSERSFQSYLPLTSLEPGGDYFLIVEGYANEEGQFEVTLECPTSAPSPPPTFAPTAATVPTAAPTAEPTISPTLAPTFASLSCGSHASGTTVGLPNASPGWDSSFSPNNSGEKVYTFVAPAGGDGTAVFDGCASTFDTVFWLIDPTRLGASAGYVPTSVDDSQECAARDALRASYLRATNLVAGRTYRFVVEGWSNFEGNYDVVVSCPGTEADNVGDGGDGGGGSRRRARELSEQIEQSERRSLQERLAVPPPTAYAAWIWVTFTLDVAEAPGKFQSKTSDFDAEASAIIGAAKRSGALVASLRAAGLRVGAIGTWSVRDVPRPALDASSQWIATISLMIVLPLLAMVGYLECKRRWQRWRATRRARVYVEAPGDGLNGIVPEADVPGDEEAPEDPPEPGPPQVETFAREMQIEQIEDGGECSICFDELNSDDAERGIIQLYCGHIFHRDCVMAWLLDNPTCPLCRRTQDARTRRQVANLAFNDAVPMLRQQDMPSACSKWWTWCRQPANCLSTFTLVILCAMVVFVVVWSFSVLL